jgi:hypothetical protein
MKMLYCEMQRIDKPPIYKTFGIHIPRAIYRAKEKSSSDKVSRIVSFPSTRLSSWGDDEDSSEFRLKIASLHSPVTSKYEMVFSWTTATNSWLDNLFERFLSRRKGNIPLIYLFFEFRVYN